MNMGRAVWYNKRGKKSRKKSEKNQGMNGNSIERVPTIFFQGDRTFQRTFYAQRPGF
jgi:hypothetical protein